MTTDTTVATTALGVYYLFNYYTNDYMFTSYVYGTTTTLGYLKGRLSLGELSKFFFFSFLLILTSNVNF